MTYGLNNWMSNLNLNPNQTLIDKKTYDMYKGLPEFQNAVANPVGNGYATIDKSIVQGLGNYNTLDTSKLGEDALSKSILGHAIKTGDSYLLSKADTDYYQNLGDVVSKSRIGYYGTNSFADPYKNASYNWRYSGGPAVNVSLDGNSGIYIPYEAATRIQQDRDKDTLNYLSDFLGNEDIFKRGKVVNLPENVVNQMLYGRDGTKEAPTAGLGDFLGTDWNLQNPGLGYLLSQEDFDNYVINKGSSGFDGAQSASNGAVNTGRALHDHSSLANSWLIRNYDTNTGQSLGLLNSLDNLPSDAGNNSFINGLQDSKWFAQSETDPNLYTYENPDGTWSRAAYDTWTEKRGGNALGKFMQSGVGQVVNALASIFVPGYAAGNALGSGVKNRNIGQAIGGAVGAFVPGLSNTIGTALGATGQVANALGNGVLSTGASLLGGSKVEDALKSGAISGLTSYGGSQIGNALGKTTLPGPIKSALGSAGTSALATILRGNTKNLGTNTLAGLFSGGLAGSATSAGMNPKTANTLASVITSLALAKQQSRRRG